MDMNTLLAIGIFLLGLGFLGVAWSLLSQASRKEKALARIDEYTEQRRRVQTAVMTRNQFPTSHLTGRLDRLAHEFSKTKAFSHFVEDEDRKLLGRAGFGRKTTWRALS